MDISYIPFSFPNITNVKCIFQTRMGGYSKGAYGGGNISFATADNREDVLKNRQSLQQTVGCELSELSQVHGDGLIFDPEPIGMEQIPKYEADGQATNKSGLGLMIKTADCQPILFCHKNGQHIMAIHAGWRGNRIEFIQSAVQRFCEKYTLLPKDILAVRGPSLGPQVSEFVNFESEWGQDFANWFNNIDKTMDLWSLTRHQLMQAGLLPAHIFGLDMCTYTMEKSFFSYRKEKLSGRQSSVIWINN